MRTVPSRMGGVMKTKIRAAISVAMLAGFYLLAFGVIGGLAWASVWLWREHPGAAAGKVSYITVLIGAGLLVALWKVLRAKPAPPEGLPLTPEQAPALWGTARELAQQVGTRAPDEIRLIPDVNAAVMEDAKLMGLLSGRRYMYVGMPLIQAFTVAQLRAVLAHELGHYSGSHTKLGALAHRGRMTIVQTIQQIGPGSVAGWIFRGYARLYLLVEQAVSRRQEFEADEAMVRLGGKEAASSALADLRVVGAAWNFYVDRYVTVGWDSNLAPQDVFGGFGHLLAARSAELAKLRVGGPPEREASRWDSHPPIPDRIAAIQRMPAPAVVVDGRPATVLLPDPSALGTQLQQSALRVEGRTLLPWDALIGTAMNANGQRQADVLFRAAARLAGVPQGSLGLVLELVGRGKADALAQEVQPHGDTDDVLESYVGVAIAIAAERSGVAHWRNSWSEGPELVDAQGVEVPVDELAKLSVSADGVDLARERMAAAGIAVDAVRQESTTASAIDSEILGGIANMKSGSAHYDVLVLSNGLVLVPGPKSTDNGRARMLQIVESAPITELAGRHRFIAYEDIAAARILKPVPVRVAITLRSGETVELHQPWTGEALTKNDDATLREALAPYVDRSGAVA